MAHLWMRDPSCGEWAVVPLVGSELRLDDGHQPGRSSAATAGSEPAVRLRKSPGAHGDPWVALCTPGARLRHNGSAVSLGIRVLRDRDELVVDGVGRVYFSTERLAQVVPFPDGEQPVVCARCKQVITPGTPGLACPQCRSWHHQSEDLPCFTYGDRCSMCDRSTDLAGEYRWVPEES